MSDLSSRNGCGCGDNGYNTTAGNGIFGGGCGNNSCLWIILLLLFCGGGCGGNNGSLYSNDGCGCGC